MAEKNLFLHALILHGIAVISGFANMGQLALVLVPTQQCWFTVSGVVYTGLPEDNPFTAFRDMSRHLFIFYPEEGAVNTD